MNVIHCYVITNDKHQFYERLQSITSKYSEDDPIILRGDLNAKAGMDNTGYEDIMRQHGLKKSNETGEGFENLCTFNKNGYR
ncbi:unnamed protein product [Schistosoma margrebowiei]|uniref:Uncharacterized protein n=1 Tax=Schistosoma margrebowiei TaxID=48269 RepID=A0A183M6E1_9TREM|nr:unnamed protein product [Schistosoma margrebowiei]